MKRICALTIALCLIFCVAGCGSDTTSSKDTNTKKSTTTATSAKGTTATTAPAPTTAPTPTTVPKSTVPQKSTTSQTETTKPAPASKKSLVIVVDPGHDSGIHQRNHPQLGVNEQDTNLPIGLACRDRLNKYQGVTVYMTREDGTCPNADGKYNTNGEYEDCILARTKVATRVKADLYVSLHCNATDGVLKQGSGGAEVYISNYPAFYKKFYPLGEKILNNITSRLNIASRGVLTRTKPEKGTYKDGTVKDYYYLISNNVDEGRPSIVIEHAFMDTINDNAILKNKKNLKTLGEADADAIAEFYGLKLK